jgi:UDP-N-acetylmuramyl pentapeptide synthase
MMELGEASAHLHERLGGEVVRYGVDALWAVGAYAGATVDGAAHCGLNGAARCAESVEEVFEELRAFLAPGDALLVKGSRGMALERLVERFRERHNVST